MRALDLGTLSKVGIYTLVVAALVALWTGGAFGPALAAPLSLAIVISWFWERPRVDPDRFGRLWTAVTTGFIGLCVYLLAFTDTGFVQVGVYLVLYLTGAKLFQRSRLADNLQLLALSFLLMAAATAYSEDVLFAFLFGTYVVVGVVTFAIHHLRVQLSEHEEGSTRPRQGLFGPRYLGVLVTLSLIAFASSVAFFFLFPRLGFGFFVQKSRQGVQQTGFSENVDLGSHGTITSDNTVVMRVTAERGALDALEGPYWRGISFDRYDGVGWSNTLERRRSVTPNQDWVFKVADLSGDAPAQTLEQTIYLEPIGSNVLFGLPSILEFGLADKDQNIPSWIQARRGISHHEGGVFRLAQVPKTGFQYRVLSWPPQYPESMLKAQRSGEGLPDHQKAAYLQLPTIDARIRALAQSVTEGAGSDYEKAKAIERHLKENYTYTTDLPDPGAEPPLEAFLFTHKRGHCEFYATAMVVMLRSIGVHARISNGFLGGAWNDFDDFFAVRNRDAHSWVEVHLAAAWWVRFDPTPPAAADARAPDIWDRVYGLYDSLKFKWLKYVIEYDLETQLELLRSAANAAGGSGASDEVSTADLRLQFAQFFSALRRNAGVTTGVFFIAFLCWLALRLRGRKPLDRRDAATVALGLVGTCTLVGAAWRPEPTAAAWIFALGTLSAACLHGAARRHRARRDPAPTYVGISKVYSRLRGALIANECLELAPHEGPQALLTRLGQTSLPSRQAIARIIDIYMATRFGGQTLEKNDLRQLQRQARTIERALRRSRADKKREVR